MGNKGNHKKRRLDMAVAAIQRRYGPSVLIRGKPAAATGSAAAIPHIPTGFAALDRALDIGGLPKGRVCEILGPATSGKTTLVLKLLAQAQANGTVGYVDQAHYFDPDYAHRCGLNLSRLLIGTPCDSLEALAMMEALLLSGSITALVVDTLDFFWTDPEAVSQLAATLTRLSTPLSRSGALLLFLHDSPAVTSPALSALAHLATIRLQVTREEWINRHGDVRGYKARVEVLKNRVGAAGRTVSIVIEFNGTVHGNDL